MLAYSSIEHMGLLALGAGLGSVALYGSLLHAVNHSLVKAALFMITGNFFVFYKSKQVAQTGGALRLLPISGALWLAGVLAITGVPPFGTFASEFTILRTAFTSGKAWVAVIALAALAVAFVGMTRIFLAMSLGPAPGGKPAVYALGAEHKASYIPALVLMLLSLGLGFWIPDKLHSLLSNATFLMRGSVP